MAHLLGSSQAPSEAPRTWYRAGTCHMEGTDQDPPPGSRVKICSLLQIIPLGFPLIFKPFEDPGEIPQEQYFCSLWIEDLLRWKKNPSCGGVDGSWQGTRKGEGLQTGPWALAPVGWDFNGVWYYFSFMLGCLLVFFSVGTWGSSLDPGLCRPCVWEGPHGCPL